MRDKADGGRVGMWSGGGLRSLWNLGKGMLKGGDDAVDLAKQEKLFRSGPISADFLENVDDSMIQKFIRTRDTAGEGGYGLYKSFDEMPAGLQAAEFISRVKKADGGINYEVAEIMIGKKLKGNESIDELLEMIIKPQKKADGGRVGFVDGGWADDLTGQGLALYNSMTAGGHSTQTIQDTLKQLGYWGGDATVDTGVQSIVNTQPAMGGDGGSGLTAINPVQYGQYGAPGYTGGLSGDVQQSGTGRVFTDPSASPIGESYSYRKEVPGWMRAAGAFIPGANWGLTAIENQMNKNRGTPSGYRVGGMDDIQKGAYNQLAGQGMLFEGPGGIKTATGKNFMGKGYMEGQQEIFDNFMNEFQDEESVIQSLKDYAAKHNQTNWKNTFKAKQWFESKNMSDLNRINEKKEAQAEKEANEKIIEQMKIANATQPTSAGGMTYNEIVDAMVQDRSESRRGKPGGIGGKELMADGGLATMFTRRR